MKSKDFEKLKEKALKETKKKLGESVNEDNFIINAINSIEEIDKNINSLSTRLREWFALVNPEKERRIGDNEKLVEAVIKEQGETSQMGFDASEQEMMPITGLAACIRGLIKTREFLELYLEKTMQDYCKNILHICGPTIGAKLLREASSLETLSKMPSGTIQLLGAEAALFRHLKSGARPPKHGHIINHPLVGGSKEKGKAARSLADKISICAKLDYFKGEFLAPKYLQELEKRFKNGRDK